MLSRRVASAAVLIPVVAVAVYFGGTWLGTVVLIAVALAMIELVQLLRKHGLRPSVIAALFLALLLAADGSWPKLQLLSPTLLLLCIVPSSIA
ncbi:MAG: phosphatidate cytidylyltransferase, partial [Anaerolineae bacterium]|nr:phosphatidate cytidylyltransferase [Anaerolineae bacterium]